MDMGVTRLALLILPLIALVVLGLLVLVIVLLANEKTRSVAKVVVGVPIVLVVCAVGFLRVSSHQVHVTNNARPYQPMTAELIPRAPRAVEVIDVGDKLGDDKKESSSRPKSGKRAKPPEAEKIAAIEETPLVVEERPDWVGTAPHKVDGVYQVAVSIGPWPSREDCDQEQAGALREKVDHYVGEYLGPEARRKISLPMAFIKSHIVREEWEETVESSVGTMTTVHLKLQFDHEANARLRQEWERVIVNQRLVAGVIGGTLLMLILSLLYAYLKIDLATGGNYRGRLRFATGASMFVMGVLALFLLDKLF